MKLASQQREHYGRRLQHVYKSRRRVEAHVKRKAQPVHVVSDLIQRVICADCVYPIDNLGDVRDDVTHLRIRVAGVLFPCAVDLMLNLTFVSNLGDLRSVDRGLVVIGSERVLDVTRCTFTLKTKLPKHG